MLINRAPKIVVFPIDGEEHLVEMPLVAGARAPPTQLVGVNRWRTNALLIGRLLMTSASQQAIVGGYLQVVAATHSEKGVPEG